MIKKIFNPIKKIKITSKKIDYGFRFSKAGYFSPYPLLQITLTQIISLFLFIIISFYTIYSLILLPFIFLIGYIKLNIRFNFKTDYDICCPPEFGIYFMNNKFWIYTGYNKHNENDFITFKLPWYIKYYKNYFLLKDLTYLELYKYKEPDSRILYNKKLKNVIFNDNNIVDIYDVILNVKITEYRNHIFKKFKILSKKKKILFMDFSYEYKNYNKHSLLMHKNESISDAFKRFKKTY